MGAKIVYVESSEVGPARSVLRWLSHEGVEVAAELSSGQLQLARVDVKSWSPRWQVAVVERALAEGYESVRWSVQARTAWAVLPGLDHEVWEWVTDELCHIRPVSVLCQYPSQLPRVQLQTVCAMHRDGLRETLLQVHPTETGLALAGEVDRSNQRLLRSALTAATATGGRGRDPFMVELDGLDFLDLAGVRALLAGTSSHRTIGASVGLRAAQPNVQRLLRMLGVNLLDGIILE